MRELLARFAADQSGAVTLEHGVVLCSIAVAIAAVLGQVGGELSTQFEPVQLAASAVAR